MHNDISQEQIQKLQQIISAFNFSYLEFIHTKNLFDDLWDKIISKNHFSKEVFYKLVASRFFPQYDKIIISDVDVVFLNDISESFLAPDGHQKYYLAGIRSNNPKDIFPLTGWKEGYKKFSQEEFQAVQNGIGGGYFIANLKQIRQDNIEQKFLDYTFKNAHKLVLAEQDVLNIICYPYIQSLSLRHMISHSAWERYGEKWEKLIPHFYSQDQINQARLEPIQLHYDGDKKPWKYPDVPKSNLWFYYLSQTPFHQEFLNQLPKTILDIYRKNQLSCKIKFYIRKNPLFFLKLNFYKKLNAKLKRQVKTLR
ncbi:glycosyltransferase [Helicobacter sp. 11S03491-1]|uniref:glycosyltransferase family 8 protein n=1 Tax=Helicobacter sp. 11S03491-1 TaxID=1476196 RepID=UPI000BD0E628|nr:glycosyltransferase [Helicobacter sp. 11S03491-1]PAF43763.1 hypothetical protein BKH45_00405 [Helicobacter sp. 11S03491-1]